MGDGRPIKENSGEGPVKGDQWWETNGGWNNKGGPLKGGGCSEGFIGKRGTSNEGPVKGRFTEGWTGKWGTKKGDQ